MGDLTAPAMLDRGDGVRIACRVRPGAGPAILFLPGYGSDMEGGKATALDAWCARTGRACVRFDWSGCGLSEGAFEAQTLARWRDDAVAVIDACAGDLVLVGSSMGGWAMLLAALARPDRVTALVGIAAAPDFSDWGYTDAEKAAILRDGRIAQPSSYGAPQVTTRAFWDSAQALRLLDGGIPIDVPVRLLHGESDAEVPVRVAHRLAAALRSADVRTVLVKGGDHRLSRPQDLALLERTVAELTESP